MNTDNCKKFKGLDCADYSILAIVISCLAATANSIDALCKAIPILVHKYGIDKVYCWLKVSIPSVDKKVITRLYLCGEGLLLRSFIFCKHAHRARLLKVGNSDQRKLENGVAVYKHDDKTVVKTIFEMEPMEFYQVVASDGKLRSIASQKAYLHTQRHRRHAIWDIDEETGVIIILRTGIIDDKDLAAMAEVMKTWKKSNK